MRILGVDPGIRGGLAIVVVNSDTAAELLKAIDIPVVGLGAKERVDVLALREWIQAQQPQHAVIERAQAMPKQGASSGFKYGRAVGSLEAVITCCEIPLTIIEPTFWKKLHGLRGGDKEGSRQRALQLFPAAHSLLARKNDHGRAESALIALSARPNLDSRESGESRRTGSGNTSKQRRIVMSTDSNNLPIHMADDGFGDALDADRVIQGTIIKCVDGRWADRDGIVFPPETKMLAISTAVCLQHWKDGALAEPPIVKQPNEPLPDIDELNAKIPQGEWETGLDDKPQAPWAKYFVVYLVNPVDASIYTFINHTTGASIAFDRLKSRVVLMRQMRGSNVVPIVKLDSREMKTRFGTKLRPEFTVLEWRQLGGAEVKDAGPARTIEHQGQKKPNVGLPVEEVSYDERFKDEVPY